ncbi:carboxypeptidase regulatory-like domain-containing protein [Amycolatopsis sp.]|uniref:carboxypeptidase regulatory-like domain-containing protein n=1 Tax=Amycolatopsis sp. TaxID=37632 RepID=UPI002C1CD15C|nr:carboxypeptidase regulatory-like domain-containing protein [Amycolatopsis sp.]HVV11214.1 carboxypeptidase regulatory-like domain-containing protein [Amycolatopsis sp.]
MSETQVPEGGAQPDDELLLAELGRVIAMADPPPAGLVERVEFALELENLDVEVARWVRDDELAGVRSSVDQGTITFTVSDLTVMINLTRTGRSHRIDGWLVPAGVHGVEVRVAEHGSSQTTADEGGRFVLEEVPRGTTQIVISVGGAGCDRTVVTPAVVL